MLGGLGLTVLASKSNIHMVDTQRKKVYSFKLQYILNHVGPVDPLTSLPVEHHNSACLCAQH